ncbi:MAG: type I 3-dehydroquinate dehydratase [Bacillota bacterium]|nr:type I 3-dehydroquinate dehydratase [Bacillota bacterium]
MRKLKVKKLILDQGRPKIAVPITGRSHEQIISDVKEAMKKPCDMLEWRADYFFGEMDSLEEKVVNTDAHMEMIRILDDIDYQTDGMPLIFTIRGRGHGGRVALDREHTYDLASLAAQSGLVDFVDMELFDDDDTYNPDQVQKQIREIHEFGTGVILSYHDYETMPTLEVIAGLTKLMRGMGADIVKIAGTASSRDQALEMMKMAELLTRGEELPVIFVAMGDEGRITRIAGGENGSAITFARGSEQTGEGQIDAATLSRLLDDYYSKKK